MQMKFNKLTKNYVIVFLLCIAMGYLIGYQFNVQKKIERISSGDEDELLAIEVATLTNANDQLSRQLDELLLQQENLEFEIANASENLTTLESDVSRYQILLGRNAVEGEGVTISINQAVVQTQLIDMLNALKNIGFEAISINGQRFIPSQGVASGYNPPLTIEVIGDKQLLKDGLERRGGVLEQIGINANIGQSDKLRIPPKTN